MTAVDRIPDGFTEFLAFLCEKYNVDPRRVFLEYSSRSPLPLRGPRPGYYDGLLSYRENNGRSEFLITVFKIAQNPLLTLGHEFAHLVDDLTQGSVGKSLGPPDQTRENKFDVIAEQDLAELHAQRAG